MRKLLPERYGPMTTTGASKPVILRSTWRPALFTLSLVLLGTGSMMETLQQTLFVLKPAHQRCVGLQQGMTLVAMLILQLTPLCVPDTGRNPFV
jgi:hypothetical protein